MNIKCDISKAKDDGKTFGAVNCGLGVIHAIFPFCLYCIVFPASFFYNFYGLSTLKDCDVAEGNNGTGPAWAAAAMMISYGFMAWWYFVCWMCGQCCFAGAEKLEKRGKSAAAATGAPARPQQPEVMGVAAV